MRHFALQAEQLGKAYRIEDRNLGRLLALATFGAARGGRELWALRGLNLALRPGTVLGVCGANGAGKSTLLRILAGTTAPSEGRFRIRGRVMSLLELGLGFHLGLSGRENLRYHMQLLGLGGPELERGVERIVDFAELEDFIDQPLRTYSSGMAMRLGFSVAAMLDPEVLILDEVFAVGDIAFQKKCVDRIRSFKERNRTVLFCSHSIYDLRQFCDEVLWLVDGRLKLHGDPTYVTGEYSTYMRSRVDLAAAARNGEAALPCAVSIRILRLGTDEEVREITTGESIEVRVRWRNPGGVAGELNLGVGFVREDNVVSAGLGTHFDGVRLSGKSGEVTLRLPRLELLSGRYLVPVWILDETGSHRFQESLPEHRLVVRASSKEVGVFRPEHEWVVTETEPDADGARP